VVAGQAVGAHRTHPGVLERWLGPGFTREELIERQSFLAQELVELFRRMSVSAIQPFVYISNNGGPTANWFIGDIKDSSPSRSCAP